MTPRSLPARPEPREGGSAIAYAFSVPAAEEARLQHGLEALWGYVRREGSLEGAPSAEDLVREAGVDVPAILAANPQVLTEYVEETGAERPLSMEQARRMVSHFTSVHIGAKWRSYVQELLDSYGA